jgi:hypothetical protein
MSRSSVTIAPAALRASRKPAALVTAQTPSLVPCFHFIMGVPAVVSVGGVVAAASDIMSVGWACVGRSVFRRAKFADKQRHA